MNSSIEIEEDKLRLRPKNSVKDFWKQWKIKELSNWKPSFQDLEGFKGLKITIDWFSKPENLSFYKSIMQFKHNIFLPNIIFL